MRPASIPFLVPELALLIAGIVMYYIGTKGTNPTGETHVIYPLLATWGSGIAILVVPIAFVSTLFFANKSRSSNLLLLYTGAALFVISQWVMMTGGTQPIISHPGFFLSGCGFGMLYSSGASLLWHWITRERQLESLVQQSPQDGLHRQTPTLSHHPRYILQQ